jgi:hypothetical protein
LNQHFAEILSELSAAGVEYLIVGAYAVAAHGNRRVDLAGPGADDCTRPWAVGPRGGGA